MKSLFILLQDAAPSATGGSSMSLIWMILIFIVIWFIMMRPQQKRAKEERKFREELKEGDRVMFSGGIYGKVHSVGATTVDVNVGNGVVLTVEKSMIQPAPANDDKETKK